VLRQRSCSESKKKKNGLSIKPKKRQKLQSGKGWRKKCAENKKRKMYGRKKRNAREIWLTV